MQRLKTQIMAEMFKTLNSDEPLGDEISANNTLRENVLINELIREYLSFNNLHHTAEVLIAGKFLL